MNREVHVRFLGGWGAAMRPGYPVGRGQLPVSAQDGNRTHINHVQQVFRPRHSYPFLVLPHLLIKTNGVSSVDNVPVNRPTPSNHAIIGRVEGRVAMQRIARSSGVVVVARLLPFLSSALVPAAQARCAASAAGKADPTPVWPRTPAMAAGLADHLSCWLRFRRFARKGQDQRSRLAAILHGRVIASGSSVSASPQHNATSGTPRTPSLHYLSDRPPARPVTTTGE